MSERTKNFQIVFIAHTSGAHVEVAGPGNVILEVIDPSGKVIGKSQYDESTGKNEVFLSQLNKTPELSMDDKLRLLDEASQSGGGNELLKKFAGSVYTVRVTPVSAEPTGEYNVVLREL
jgi:hypothetical protein